MVVIPSFVCLWSTRFKTGVIWFVQVVQHPLLGEVGPGSLGRHYARHVRRIGPEVGAAIEPELPSAFALVIRKPAGSPGWLASAGLGAIGAAWLSTTLAQVPPHRRRSPGFDRAAAGRLARSHWVRIAAWSSHASIALATVGLARG